MAKILIVDDEPRYCELISHVLCGAHQETRTAGTGREALDIGARYRPDVLVTDWMLKDDIHGLHVVEVLRAFLPDLRSILMTGFPSNDLRAGACKAGVHAFLIKPFDAEQIRTAVQEAVLQQQQVPGPFSLAMIAVDSRGAILFANSAAKEMMCETKAGPGASSLEELFGGGTMPDLDAAVHCWVAVPPRSNTHKSWHLRSQEPHEDGSRLVVLCRWDEPRNMNSAMIEMFLGIRGARRCRWPFDQRILVVDDEAIIRRWFVSMLESLGAGCYAAATHEDACRLLENDRGIGFMILNFNMPGVALHVMVEKTRAVRPDVVIVGNSGTDHRDDFAAMGVEYFLQKPWCADELINILIGRIGNCVSCGLPTPLRRPKPGESVRDWECLGCGRHYTAVFDEDCSADARLHVRPVDPD